MRVRHGLRGRAVGHSLRVSKRKEGAVDRLKDEDIRTEDQEPGGAPAPERDADEQDAGGVDQDQADEVDDTDQADEADADDADDDATDEDADQEDA